MRVLISLTSEERPQNQQMSPELESMEVCGSVCEYDHIYPRTRCPVCIYHTVSGSRGMDWVWTKYRKSLGIDTCHICFAGTRPDNIVMRMYY
jgi:hypothetical protein